MMMGWDNAFSEFIYLRTYSRWDDQEGRRETWPETVGRYHNFFTKRLPTVAQEEFKRATDMVLGKGIMPSMRCLWSAGKALERENIAGYNCAYTTITEIKDFSEILYVLMCGTGVGFSVERQYIVNLPEVPELVSSNDVVVFEDSKLGWAEGLYHYMKLLWSGKIPTYDLSKIRPKGAKLKTFGGRASGPEPLKSLLDYTLATLKGAQGRKLNSLECHDIVCMIANSVVVGGVRRSATISFSNLSDNRMRHAKDGDFYVTNPQRSLANNSVAYTEKPDAQSFIEEWLNLVRSNTGERGIFNREGANLLVSKIGRRRAHKDFGANPCNEVILRPKQFCNLTEVVVRSTDTIESLLTKTRYATILGCVQATLTKFNFLSREWKKNTEEERLLGVSLTGLRDHPVLNSKSYNATDWLFRMRQEAIRTAEEWSKILDINMPTAITCVKPSGTVSQLVGSASGLHPRFSPYYIRRVRVSSNDPVAQFMSDSGVPWKPENGETVENHNIKVFEFPVASPESSIITEDVDALEQLEYWKMLQDYWCEHKPSATIYVKDSEWMEVGAWVYKNWNYISGLSFLPSVNSVYQLKPYDEITEEEYVRLMGEFPKLEYSRLKEYEQEDGTVGAQEYACSGGSCEL